MLVLIATRLAQIEGLIKVRWLVLIIRTIIAYATVL